jgi:hypothetical protein
MLTTEQLKKLKLTNVSQNADKTRERLKKDFNAASNAVKSAIVELSGQSRRTLYRAYEKGSASGRIILSMAEVLKISPFYYTGESDERSELQDADIIRFLQSRGYSNLAGELSADEPPAKPKRKNAGKPKIEPAPELEATPEPLQADSETQAADEAEEPKSKRKYTRKQKAEPASELEATPEPTSPVLADKVTMEESPSKPKRKYNRKPKAPPVATPEAMDPVQPAPEAQAAVDANASETVVDEDITEIKITLPDNKAVHVAVASLSEEDIFSLLKALLVKEKAGGAPAKMAEIVKRILLV